VRLRRPRIADKIEWYNSCRSAIAYWELAAVSLQTGRLLSLTRTLLLPVQRWHPVFRCEKGLPGRVSNLPVFRDAAGPLLTGSRRPQRRTLGYRLLQRLVLLTVLALLIVWRRLRWWHWLVKTLLICKQDRDVSANLTRDYYENKHYPVYRSVQEEPWDFAVLKLMSLVLSVSID